MDSHAARRLAALVASVAVLPLVVALAACAPAGGSGKPPADDTPAAKVGPGTCLDGSVSGAGSPAASDLGEVVGCDEPHSSEVISVVDLPGGWIDAKDSVSEISKERDSVVASGGAHFAEYGELVDDSCLALVGTTAGVDAPIGGIAKGRPWVMPNGLFDVDRSVPSPERIKKEGKATLTCAVRYVGADGKPAKVASTTADPVIRDFAKPDFPVSARMCETHNGTGYEQTACDEPHGVERFVYFDAYNAFGADFVARGAAADASGGFLSDADYEMADKACNTAYADLVGTKKANFLMRFEMLNAWSKVPAEKATGMCILGPKEWGKKLVTGSLVGLGDTAPTLTDK